MFDDRSVRTAKFPWSEAIERGVRPLAQRESRVCSEPGCDARTSIYNSNDTCWLHTEPGYPLPPAGRGTYDHVIGGDAPRRDGDPRRLVDSEPKRKVSNNVQTG
jgi:hypothetical protein